MTTMSKLPTEGRPPKMDPDLATALEELLAPHSGKALERAQAAVLKLRKSGAMGTFSEIVEAHRAAIEAAAAEKPSR
jgi:uncharacterized protein